MSGHFWLTFLWSAQDALQPVRPLVAHGSVRPDLRRPGAAGPDGETIMIDSTHLKAHRTAARPPIEGGLRPGRLLRALPR